MKQFNITVICAGIHTKFTGIFKSSFDALLAGMDQQTDPFGRVEVKPA